MTNNAEILRTLPEISDTGRSGQSQKLPVDMAFNFSFFWFAKNRKERFLS